MKCERCDLEIGPEEKVVLEPKSARAWHVHCADVRPALEPEPDHRAFSAPTGHVKR